MQVAVDIFARDQGDHKYYVRARWHGRIGSQDKHRLVGVRKIEHAHLHVLELRRMYGSDTLFRQLLRLGPAPCSEAPARAVTSGPASASIFLRNAASSSGFISIAVGAGLRAAGVRNRGDPLQLAFHVFRGRLGLLVRGFGWILAVKHGATSIGLGRR